MKTIELTGAALSTPQGIVLFIFAMGVVFLLVVFGYMLYLLIKKPEINAAIEARKELFREESRLINAQNERNMAENERNLAKLQRGGETTTDRNENAPPIDDEIAKMRGELLQQGVAEGQANEISTMTLAQIQGLKSKEMTDVSGAFIINAITRRVLIDSEFEPRADIRDFKVPKEKTKGVRLADVEKQLLSLPDVTKNAGVGKRADTFKTADRTIALLYDLGGGNFKLTVKCGPYYGLRLCGLYPEFVEKAKYPYGMTWFNISSDDECSMELLRLLTGISYHTAKAGF